MNAIPFAAIEPAVQEDIYQLTQPGHVLYMAQHPDKNYVLRADIDMGGMVWEPIDDFSGSLDGLIHFTFNYSISNLVIRAAEGEERVGFCRTVSGKIKDVIFENVSLACPGTFSGDVGLVAGLCTGKLIDVNVKNGRLQVAAKDANVGFICGKTAKELKGCECTGDMQAALLGGTCYVGGAVGYAEERIYNVEARTNMTVSGIGTGGATGGIAGCCCAPVRDANYGGHFKVSADAAHAAGTLVGKQEKLVTLGLSCARSTQIDGAVCANGYCGRMGEKAALSQCYTRDTSNLEETIPADEYARRKKAEQYMYNECTVRWIPTKDMDYTDNCAHDHTQHYDKGIMYFGMPYTHLCRSLAEFNYYRNADKTLKDVVPAEGWDTILGNDCADSIYWAWAQISADISYTLTRNMICVNGTYPVGGYDVVNTKSTTDICCENGLDAMCEAYAQVRIGDATLMAPGHVRMASENAYVFRNPDGSINPDRSYILSHEQGAGCSHLKERRTTCLTHKKFSFTALFNTNYIPVTIKAFTEGEDTLEVKVTDAEDGMLSGKLSSNFRLDEVLIRVLDAQQQVVFEDAVYPCDGEHTVEMDLRVFRPVLEKAALEPGKQYTYKILVNGGAQQCCVQNFTFTA